jgi:diguanylate cyclase (GGDEF)-like protein
MAVGGRRAIIASYDLNHTAVYWTLLLDLGYEVQVARGGDGVRQLVQRDGIPELLIVDVWLPRTDGINLVRRLRRDALRDRMGVVMFSAREPLREVARQLMVPLGIARVLPADADRTLVREAIQAATPKAGREDVDATSGAPPMPAHGRVERDQRAELIEALKRDAATDVLTGLLNRRGGQQNIDREIARAKRTKQPVSLILFDIDKFKETNDTFGHPTGDRVLREVSALLRNTVRPYDILARWGGEEFLIFLSADLTQARRLGERIRHAVETLKVEPVGRITVSGGISANDAHYDFDKMFHDADQRLFQAKKAGRNRIVASDFPSSGVE